MFRCSLMYLLRLYYFFKEKHFGLLYLTSTYFKIECLYNVITIHRLYIAIKDLNNGDKYHKQYDNWMIDKINYSTYTH